jgi:hypothetical protein
MVKCPETLEELEELERLLPLCRKDLTKLKEAKLEAGAARTGREAERQIAEELDRPFETVRSAIKREEQSHKVGAVDPLCETESQASAPSSVPPAPICSLWTRDQGHTPLPQPWSWLPTAALPSTPAWPFPLRPWRPPLVNCLSWSPPPASASHRGHHHRHH